MPNLVYILLYIIACVCARKSQHWALRRAARGGRVVHKRRVIRVFLLSSRAQTPHQQTTRHSDFSLNKLPGSMYIVYSIWLYGGPGTRRTQTPSGSCFFVIFPRANPASKNTPGLCLLYVSWRNLNASGIVFSSANPTSKVARNNHASSIYLFFRPQITH